MMVEYEYTMTLGELLQEFRRKYGSLAKLRRRVASGRGGIKAFGDLEEWEHYVSHRHKRGRRHTHKLEERIRFRTTVIFHDRREFFRVMTPERLRILDELRSGKRFDSLNELAKRLGRDPKNVSEDVKLLASKNLVEVERRNARRSIPRARVGKIVITM